jgi:hypothetical protein
VTGRDYLPAPDARGFLVWRRLPLSDPPTSDNWPHTRRPLPWCLAGFMAMLWLLPFDSIDLPISLPLDAKFDRPILLLIVALWTISLATARNSGSLRLSPIHYAFSGFILIAIISLVHGADATVRLGDFELGVRKLALLISYFVLFVVVASSIRPGEVRPFMKLTCGLAVVMAIGTLIEYRTGYNVFFELTRKIMPVTIPAELGNVDSIGRKSVIGPTIHPLAPAMMLACTMPFALISMYDSPELRRKILWGLAAGVMISAALATGRKTSIVAPVAALMVLVAYRPRILRQLAPAAVGLFVIVHIAAPGSLGSVGEALLPQNFFGNSSTVNRQSDYGAVKPDVVDHPLLGRGYETYDQKKYRILDNQYLTTVIGTGALGILAYLSIFVAIFLVAHRVARNGRGDRVAPALAIAAASVAMVIGSALLDLLALPQIPYILCFFAGFVAVLSRETAPGPALARARRAQPTRPVPSAAKPQGPVPAAR